MAIGWWPRSRAATVMMREEMAGLLDPDLRAVAPVGGACHVHVVGGAGADLVVHGAAFLDADDIE
eukprot:12880965-Heterocapsa_arctica.AAC.1